MKNRYLISLGTEKDAKEFHAGFASEIIDQATYKIKESELAAQMTIQDVLARTLGTHTYTIWKLVPIKTIIRASKPVEFETKIVVCNET